MASKSDKPHTGNRIRQEFVDFFKERGHTFVPSSSLIPQDDPTLLFTNAGMNQFKDVFLGTGTRPYTRAANSQKCIRAGGKHNDLEEVGHDDYHHTFFEMLGNWSFGDYFKAEAIAWAWELLTGRWGVPKARLYATVFGGDKADGLAADDEAAELWRTKTDIDPAHIMRGSRKDNFWEMADTGPCGPCSEIHIDLTADLSGAELVNKGDARVIEIWNLVFIQFNRGPDGRLSPLPARHVDTGMGFERIARVLQGVQSNYATDIFGGLFAAIQRVTGAPAYAGRLDDMKDVAYRVVGDHARALTFALADGGRPSNEGRGYVLRRILRRAGRYGRQYLNTGGKEFLYRLVEPIVQEMGEAFVELKANPAQVAEMIREEEASFNRTLDRGLALFEAEAARVQTAGQTAISGQTAFELYATFGFPVDLTQLMARERGLTVQMDVYDQAMESHRQTSAAGGGAFKAAQVVGLPSTDDSAKYGPLQTSASVAGWVLADQYVASGKLAAGQEAALVLDRTNFYAESGGQVGDAGRIITTTGQFAVKSTYRQGDCVLHVGTVEQGEIHPGQTARLIVDHARAETMRNHTATHLLNWALREVLGAHVQQAGSVVDPERLRFDFTHNKAMSDEEQAEVERLVNERVLADEPVGASIIPLSQARKITGVRAMFGEKYPDPVRVISISTADPLGEATQATPVEFCGGTHLSHTAQVGLFKIVGEESVAKGVRRITAVTGRAALAEVQHMDRALRAAVQTLAAQPEQLAERIIGMQKELKTLRKKLESGAAPRGGDLDALVASAEKVGDVKLIVGELPAGSVVQLRSLVDQLRQKAGDRVAIMVGWVDDGKVTLIASVSDAVIVSHGLNAGDWVRDIAPLVGGGGGGKPQMAQAGGKEPDNLPAALAAAVEWASERLK